MKRVTLIAMTLVLALIATLSVKLAAQDTNTQERTFLTFSGPVELPGVSLPAGTYVFRLADTPSRNVVQVLSRDEKDVMGQWTFVQAQRNRVSQDTVIMFKEAREGSTPAVQFWYYPGESIGKEFIYPKEQAQKIASRTGAEVLSDDGRITSNSTVSSTDAKGEVTSWPREGAAPVAKADDASAIHADADSAAVASAERTQRDAPAASQPTAAAGSLSGNRGVAPAPEPEATVAQAETQPAPATAVGTSGRASELPSTASPLPLSGLIGLLSLAGALSARVAAARR